MDCDYILVVNKWRHIGKLHLLKQSNAVKIWPFNLDVKKCNFHPCYVNSMVIIES